MILLELESDFPMADFEAITKQLLDWNILVPGFHPPTSGVLSWDAIQIAEIENVNIQMLIDRNIATELASIAKNGVQLLLGLPANQAAHLMAFAQIANWNVEPSISYHELASHIGNEKAYEELSWFRAADDCSQRSAWMDIACGRALKLHAAVRITEPQTNLAFPLDRWRRNYVVALKIAELELSDMLPLARVFALSNWMEHEFFFAGPAFFFAAMYFSPKAARQGMFKQLRGKCRDKAVAGIKNEAWDITYLSEFIRLIGENNSSQNHYVFATADKNLAKLAQLLFRSNDDESQIVFCDWWPANAAQQIVKKRRNLAELASRRPTPTPKGTIHDLICSGEAFVKGWDPK